MKRISRVFLFGAVTVILLAAACAPEEGAPIVAGALQATDTTGTAETTTATVDITLTPSIPVTGLEVITLDCQYCVDNIAHAQLLIPRDAKFEVISPEELASASNNNDDDDKEGNNNGDDNGNNNGDDDDDNGGDDKSDRLGCRTIDRFRDTQLVLCRAEENTTITLNICLKDKTTCTEVQITLQSCAPTATPTPFVPITATATGTAATFTPVPITETPTVTATPVGSATATPTPAVLTNTPVASATSTPTATPTATSTPTP